MPTRLMDLKIRAVAVVDHPDNPDADILLFKRRDMGAATAAETKEDGMAGDKTPEQFQEELDALTKEKDEAVSKSEELEGKVTDLEAKVTELEAKIPVEEPEEKVDPEVQKRLDESDAKVAKAEAEVAKMRDEQDTKDAEEAVAKLASIPGLTADFAPVLKRLRQANTEDATAVEKALADANAALEASKALETNGADGQGELDVVKRVKDAANEMVKANPEMTYIQAEAKVWKTNPDWQTEYNEQREG